MMPNDALEKLKAIKNGEVKPIMTTISNGHIDANKVKSDAIAKAVALNCAAQLTEAYAHIIAATEMVKTMDEPQIKNWLKSMKQTEYSDNLKLLTGKDQDIPF